MARIVLRVRKENGEVFVLARYPDTNKFELCDPSLDDTESKKRSNQIQADTVDEAIELIEKGMRPRMLGTDSGRYVRAALDEVRIFEVPE